MFFQLWTLIISNNEKYKGYYIHKTLENGGLHYKIGGMISITVELQYCFLSKPQLLVIIEVASNVKKDRYSVEFCTLLLVLLGNHGSKTFC